MENSIAATTKEEKTFWHYWVIFLCILGQIFPSKKLFVHTEGVISKRILKLNRKEQYKIHKYPDIDSPTGHVFFVDKKSPKKSNVLGFEYAGWSEWEPVKNRKGNSFYCYKLVDAQKAVEQSKKGEILI